MSFGGQANQPWQRNIMPFQNVAPQQMYMNNSGYQHGQIQSGGQMYGNAAAGNTSVAYAQTYNSIGTVTKINNDCGLVNDEVFFYRNVCKGTVPKLGDRVLFEATMSTTGQFKWNATRIQSMAPQPLMATAIGGGGVVDNKGSSRYGNVPPPDYRGLHSSPVRERAFRVERREREEDRGHLRRSRDREDAERDRKRRREDLDRSREVERSRDVERSREVEREDRGNQNRANNAARNNREEPRRDRDHSNERKERERRERIREREREHEREREREHEREREREREKERHISPKGRSMRAVRRYKVQIPRHSLVCHELTIPDLRQRYPSLYIPSLFFHADVLWPQTFTFEKPFSLRRASQFLIMHESVEVPIPFNKEELDPTDCDYSYSAKVILLECPSLADIYQKCFKDDGEENSVHLSRLIRFLFGTRGDNSPMAIGGYWSPSLDGPNPGKDPAVLIRTAIRTCKALTGIDLSNCTQWYRFCEYHYENDKNSTNEPARVETVVIFLPDVHSCMPTTEEWKKLASQYRSAADNVIAQREQLLAAASNSKAASNNDAETDAMDTTTTTTNEEKSTSEADDTKLAEAAEQQGENTAKEDTKTPVKQQQAAALDKSTDGDDNENEKDNDKSEPTHYSKLDLKSMKVQEMRDELIARNLSPKGVRTVIMARLAKALNTEKAEEAKAEKKAKLKARFSGPKKETVKVVESKKSKDDDDDDDDDVQIISDDNEEKKENTSNSKENKNDSKTEEKTASDDKVNTSETKTDENDEQEEWGGGMDVDMNDIVILDEYDSRKNPEDTQLKEFTEKDKERIIRRYTLPSSPHIIVHPNRAAKSGKFDCMVTSLANLLDYGPGNSKQRFFEVALFAELFKEMLMRDFSFNIYKEIYFHNQNKINDQEEAETKENGSANKDDKNAEKSEEKPAKENNGVESKSEDGQTAAKTSNKRKSNAAASDEKDKEAVNEHKNMVTVKPHLLLSFLYFDATHCGYIYKRDMEEMFYLCGLSLSRAQIHAFLDKLSNTNAFQYRKITDKEAVADETHAMEDIDEIDEETFKKLSAGNFALFDCNDEDENDETGAATETEDGLINHNGTVIHVGKLVDQIKRTEKSLSDMEKLYNDIRREHNDLQKTYNKTNNKMKDLQSEVKSLQHKLSDTNRDLNSVNRKYREEHSVLTLVYNRLTPFVGRDKEKDHKSESSRSEKDKSKTKDKDKDESKKGNEKSDKNKSKEDTKDVEKTSKKNGENKEETKPDSKTETEEDSKIENNTENSKSAEASNDDEENGDEVIIEE